MWDLSSQIRDGSCVPCTRKWMLNHWATREVPNSYHLFKFKSCLKDPPKFPFTKSFANIYSAPISSCANRKKQNLCPWEVQLHWGMSALKQEKRTCRGKCSTCGLYLELVSEKVLGSTAKWEQSPRYRDARKSETPEEPGKEKCAWQRRY